MSPNKKRLYIAVYPSGISNDEERRYHWGFLIGPKAEGNGAPGIRCHVKNSSGDWEYERVKVKDVKFTTTLLARILVAKIEDEQRLTALFRRLPVVQNDPSWRCRTWVANALVEIEKDGKCVGTAELDWQKIEAFARRYVSGKTIGGRYERDLWKPRPTWDLLEDKETLP
ncbi:hypothetical protein GGR51DRAFT_563145 [Nemania sp. FL0031]|nr:hypothetical protein GGR51DRAFT_563145 [Nemania sp. FL0031]